MIYQRESGGKQRSGLIAYPRKGLIVTKESCWCLYFKVNKTRDIIAIMGLSRTNPQNVLERE